MVESEQEFRDTVGQRTEQSPGDLVLGQLLTRPFSLYPPEVSIASGGALGLRDAWRGGCSVTQLIKGGKFQALHMLCPQLVLASFYSFFRFQIMDHFLVEALPTPTTPPLPPSKKGLAASAHLACAFL